MADNDRGTNVHNRKDLQSNDSAEADHEAHRRAWRDLLAKVRELIHQGNVRRIIIISEKGDSILEIPLTAGVIGAIVAPVLVAIGAIAALANNYTLLIEATRQSRQPATSPATSSRTAPNGRRSRGNRGDEPAVAGR